MQDKKIQYQLTTNKIQINVKTEYVDNITHANDKTLFVWLYHITIENQSDNDVQLIKRFWKIIDENGKLEEVDGEGVVGKQPIIKSGSSFEYSSGVNLQTHSGIMSGYYQMTENNGMTFDAIIPKFSLDIPHIKQVIN